MVEIFGESRLQLLRRASAEALRITGGLVRLDRIVGDEVRSIHEVTECCLRELEPEPPDSQCITLCYPMTSTLESYFSDL